jgi:plasmid stabilization system protein ParE
VSLRRIVLPEIAEEIAEAVRWYENRDVGLGVEFLACVEQAMDRVAKAPEAAAVWPNDRRFRRHVLPRVPYVLVYELRAESIEFVAVAHTSRPPGYWLSRAR